MTRFTAHRTTRTIGLGAALATATVGTGFAASASAGKTPPTWMNISFDHSVVGNTLTYDYADSGVQLSLMSDGADGTWQSPESTGHEIDFGDGSPHAGSNGGGGFTCNPQGSPGRFSTHGPATAGKHTYATPGTYTVKVTGSYCGGGGEREVTKQYTVTVGSSGATTTKPAPTPSATPSKPAPTKPTATAPAPTSKAAPKVGPTVQTDHVKQANSNVPALALVGGASALGLGAVGLGRRARRNDT